LKQLLDIPGDLLEDWGEQAEALRNLANGTNITVPQEVRKSGCFCESKREKRRN